MNENEVMQYIDGQDRYNKILTKELEEQKIRNMSLNNQAQQTAGFNISTTQNIVELQLSPDKIIQIIKHSINNDIEGLDSNGNEVWLPQTDDRAKIFTPYGVQQIVNLLNMYINPNVLLSKFDSQQVQQTMKRFAIELSDLIYNRLEFFFNYPSPETLFDRYYPVCKKYNVYISDNDLYELCKLESDAELQRKFRHYDMVCWSINHLVHATYLRALDGKERESLRKFLNVSENVSSNMNPSPQIQKPGFFKRIGGSG